MGGIVSLPHVDGSYRKVPPHCDCWTFWSKSTIIRRAIVEFPEVFGFSVSHTTRDPRPGELNAVAYHFVTKSEMERLIGENDFIEHAIYNDNYYGTSKKSLKILADQQKIALMDIEMTGVGLIHKSESPARFVFIEPPSIEEFPQ